MSDNNKKKAVLTDFRTPDKASSALSGYGYEVIPVPPADYLPWQTASHPDMLFFVLGGTVCCHSRYALSAEGGKVAARLEELGYIIELSDFPAGSVYPHDVQFNCAVCGNRLIASRHADPLVRALAERNGLETVTVRQGYVKCSCAVAEGRSGSGIVTSDMSVFENVLAAGIRVLKTAPGGVALKGYDTGFIGGATGCEGSKLFFCGDIETHPDAERICGFVSDLGCETVSLVPGLELTDVGSLLFV